MTAENPHVSCDSCDWTVTIGQVVAGEQDRFGHTPDAKRVRDKFGSLGEGHAYFNRGHTIKIHGTVDDIREVL